LTFVIEKKNVMIQIR